MPAAAPHTEPHALLERTQSVLERLYGIEVPHRATDFLLTDAALAGSLAGLSRIQDETLLVHEDEEGLSVSLYLDAAMLERLSASSPHEGLDAHNLDDFWSVVEGVSHFVYLAWNAQRRRSVTPMELELQAEVDKFVTTAILLARQRGGMPRGLHRMLFDCARVADDLPPAVGARYRDANRYAGRYCLVIEREYLQRRRAGMLDELRAFWRSGRGDKLARIGTP